MILNTTMRSAVLVCVWLLCLLPNVIMFRQRVKSLTTNIMHRLKPNINLPGLKDKEAQLPTGFERSTNFGSKRPKKPSRPIRISNIRELKDHIRQGYRVRDLDVRGNVTFVSDHPVMQTLYERKATNRTNDGKKVALVIEGGGMRGVVGAGMATAVWYLGLADSIDAVYGSSAGSLVGAYFITRQLPYYGPEVYYKHLPQAKEEFIDMSALLRSCGLGLLDVRPQSLINFIHERIGKPVLNLNYLLDTIVKDLQPIDWESFWSKQVSKKQVLKIVASGLLSRKSILMSAEEGHFSSLSELTNCMRASMLLPGLTGDAARLKNEQATSSNMNITLWPDSNDRSKQKFINGSEPMSDAFIFEPIPYRSALKDNCTHILVLRTRADDSTVTAKMGLLEKMIIKRYFGRKLKLPQVMSWMINQYHKLVYAEDILILNEANKLVEDKDYDDIIQDTLNGANIYTVALPPGIPEVKRMETRASVLLDNVRLGFAAAYDSLQTDDSYRGQGYKIAKEIWPDSLVAVENVDSE